MESSKSPEKCTICLGEMENRAVVDGCLHEFCYSCLKEWSKIKAVCPLCKHSFSFVMYNIRANDDYDKYVVPKPVVPPNVELDHFPSFRHWEHETNHVVDHWMSSRIHEWRERIQQDQENYRAAIVAATSTDVIRRRRKYYREGVQVSHVKNNKRVRDISTRFFRDNLPQSYRLVPWLKRELIVLFGANNIMLVNRVCDVILSALPTLGIRSVDFYNEIRPYLMERTDHFLKEFISFASSPHDLSTYDSNARYPRAGKRPAPPASWSSDDDGEVPPGPSLPNLYSTTHPEPPPLAHMRNRVPLGRRFIGRVPKPSMKRSRPPPASDCIVISSGGSSGESDVEFVRFIKPPHLRTPDTVIDLSSDEDEKPGPSRSGPPLPPSSSSDSSSEAEVKVTLKSVVVPVSTSAGGTSSDSDRPTTSRRHRSSGSGRERSGQLASSSYRRPLKKIIDRKRSSPNNAFTRHLRRRLSSTSDEDFAFPYIRSERKRSERDEGG